MEAPSLWTEPVGKSPDGVIIKQTTTDPVTLEETTEEITEIVLSGFRVSYDGQLIQDSNFLAPDKLVLEDGELEFDIGFDTATWAFVGNEIYFQNTRVRGSAFGDYHIDGLSLNSIELDYSLATMDTYFEQFVKGFLIRGNTSLDPAYPVDAGIPTMGPGVLRFSSAILRIPGDLTDSGSYSEILLSSLELDAYSGEILIPGENRSDDVMLSTGQLSILADDFNLSEGGLIARGVADVPDYLDLPSLLFETVRIEASPARITSSDLPKSDEYTLFFHGQQVSTHSYYIEDDVIKFSELSASLGGDWDNRSAVFSGLTMDNEKILTTAVDNTQRLFTQDGWEYAITSMRLDDDGVFGTGSFNLPSSLGGAEVEFDQLERQDQSRYELGPVIEDLAINVQDWIFITEQFEIQGPNLYLSQPRWWLPEIYSDESFILENIVITNEGQIASHGQFLSKTGVFRTRNGFEVTLRTIQMDVNKITFGGDLQVPANAGGGIITYGDGELRLLKRGYLQSTPMMESRNYRLVGWDVSGTGSQLTRDGLVLAEMQVTPSNGISTLTLPGLTLDSNGDMVRTSLKLVPFTFNIIPGQLEASVHQVTFDEDGLGMRAHVVLPDVIGVKEVYFEKIVLMPDGSVWSNTLIPVIENHFDELGIGFRFTNIWFKRDGFSVHEAELQLPEIMDSRILRINDFRIGFDGSFSFGNIDFEPLDLWGYEFMLKSLAIENGVFDFTGSVRFPLDFFIPSLGGATLNINEFALDTKKLSSSDPLSAITFDLLLDGTLEFMIFDTWTVVAENIGVSTTEFSVETGKILLPPEYGMDNVTVEGLTVNMRTGAVDVGLVSINGVKPLYFAGLEFNVHSATLSQDEGFVFVGDVQIPEAEPGGVEYPEILQGSTLDVSRLQIRPDFSVGDLEAKLSGLNGNLFTEDLRLVEGWVEIEKTDEDLIFDVGGGIKLLDGFPLGVRGKTINVNTFKVNVYTGEILALNAGLGLGENDDPLSFKLFGAIDVEATELWFGTSTTSDGYELGVVGALVMKEQFPEELQNKRVNIDRFLLDTEGGIIDFAASFTPGVDMTLLEGLTWKNPHLGVVQVDQTDLEFSVGGSLEFGDSFPDAIVGSSLVIQDFRFNSKGEIYDGMDVYYTVPEDTSLFGLLKFRETTIRLGKDQQGFFAGFEGRVVLPDSLPEGFKELEINIVKLEMYTDGEIRELEMGFDGLDINLYDVLVLKDTGLTVTEEEGVFVFDVVGNLVLPDAMPGDLAGATVAVDRCLFTSAGEMREFSAAFTQSVSFDLFAGIKTQFDLIAISNTGFRLGGALILPNTLPEGFPSQINLDLLEMTWGGEVVEIAAGIDSLTIDLFGLQTSIVNISVDKDRMNIESGLITLPPAMGGQTITMTNAGINFNGGFYGELGADNIYMGFSGFELTFMQPSMNFETGIISFASVLAALPAELGGMSTEIYEVTISGSGVNFGGGVFTLPDFTIAGGLGFRNTRVAFRKSGDNFDIEGTGAAVLPDGSTLEAELAFTNISDIYPIGLRRAFFSYTIQGAGIPIGTSGVYINGIRGGIAFGPPDEVPEPVRWLFDAEKGMRLTLGLTLSAGNPKLLRGDVDAWVDLWNFAWAISGRLVVLDGMGTAQAMAGVSNQGMYLGMWVNVTFARGEAEIWVFPHGNETLINGMARVEIGIPRGAIIREWWCTFPNRTWWLGEATAQFGKFTNNQRGLVAGFKLPFIGRVGIFVSSSGSIKLGVSGYRVILPEGVTR